MRIPTIMNVQTMLSGKQFMYCLRMVVSLLVSYRAIGHIPSVGFDWLPTHYIAATVSCDRQVLCRMDTPLCSFFLAHFS